MGNEILLRNLYGEKVDAWSLGVIGYILLTGQYPFSSKHYGELLYQIKHGKYKTKGRPWNSISPGAKSMVASLLTVRPEFRMSAKQALLSSWILDDYESLSSHDLCKNPAELKKLNAKEC